MMATQPEGKDDSIRGLLGEAFDEHEEKDVTPDGDDGIDLVTEDTAAAAPELDAPEPKTAKPAKPAKAPVDDGKDKDPEADGAEGKESGKEQKKKVEKGPDGKFRKVVDETKAGEEAKEKEDQTQLPKSKAPGSWKPAAREKWNGLPAEIQQEVLRRERDIATGFNEVAEVKKFRDQFGGLVTQHQGIINAEGGDAMAMTRNLYTTAAVLYNGTPQQKVATVAGFIRNFGVDIAMLDQHLSDPNAAPPQRRDTGNQDAASFIRTEIQAALAPILKQREDNVGQSIEEFASDPKNEFFEDVKDTMADILELAAKRGQKMTLQDAYKRATLMDSEIAEVIQERSLREKTQQRSSAASQARKRAVSLKTTPSTELASGDPAAAEKSGQSLRSDILSAVDALTE
jgi:hypothetical protein